MDRLCPSLDWMEPAADLRVIDLVLRVSGELDAQTADWSLSWLSLVDADLSAIDFLPSDP